MTKKLRMSLTTIFLVIIFALSFFLLHGVLRSKTPMFERSINADEISTLAYQSKLNSLKEEFEQVSTNSSESSSGITGTLKDTTVLDSGEEVTTKLSTDYNYETNIFTIITTYFDKDENLVSEKKEEFEPLYDEELDEVYIIDENSEKVFVKDILQVESLNQCVAITATATAATAAVALLAIAIVAAEPTIITNVVTSVTYVAQRVCNAVWSIFRWFCRVVRWIWTTVWTAVTTTTIVKTMTPAITIEGVRYETEELTKEKIDKKINKQEYYIAFADATNGKMYISICPITADIAVAILLYPCLIPCIGNSAKEMIVSVYSFNQIDAYNIAKRAGIAKETPEVHGAVGSGYYMHYHSIAYVPIKNGLLARPHAFFGLPL